MSRFVRSAAVLFAIAGALAAQAACSSAPVSAPERTERSSAAILAAPTIETFVVYAGRAAALGEGTTVVGGDIGVGAIGTVPPQLDIGRDSFLDPAHYLLAPSVLLGMGSSVGTVQAGAVFNLGATVAGTGPYGVRTMPPAPVVRFPTGSGPDVVVAAGQVTTLYSGAYGALTVDGTAYLEPGFYSFASVRLADGAALYVSPQECLVSTVCAAHVTIGQTLSVGAKATLAPYYVPDKVSSPPPAWKLDISVAGNDVGATPAALIGAGTTMRALLSVPEGSLRLGEQVTAVGALSSFNFASGPQCLLAYDSGFSPDVASMQQLSGYYGPSPFPVVAPVLRVPSASALVALDIGLPVVNRHDRALSLTVKDVSDPHSSKYRHYLTQAEFAQDWGPTQQEYDQLKAWATTQGFVIDKEFPNRLLLSVHGTVGQIENALHANLILRRRPAGSAFITVDRDPSVDLDRAQVPILWINGLDDDFLPRPSLPTGTVNGTYSQSSFAAADFRAAYLAGRGGSTPACGATTTFTGCQSLTGQGQVVGVYSFVTHNPADISTYDTQQSTGINPNDVLADVEIGGPVQFANSSTETPMDIELVQAMAPQATIITFDELPYVNVWNLGHVDGAYHAMATSNPPLTVGTNSWNMGRDPNEQQALYEMAMQGVSFFGASGDYGNLDDPQDWRDMDAQTLVGGTFLSTSGSACGEAYLGENTWNGGTPGADITGGGIMSGTQNLNNAPLPPEWVQLLTGGTLPGSIDSVGICDCWPYPFCCGPGVDIPFYQVPLMQPPLNAGNHGSTKYRNYPDVSMVASNIGEYVNGAPFVNGGTSAAAPLWAGFMALADELSVRNGASTIGFANPALYEIGQTRGALVDDLYSGCFNDINDGVTNGVYGGTGYPSIVGYDLATGLGTPTCNLIFQLATTTPLTNHTPLYWMELVATTGNDDLRSDSALTATLRFHNGAVLNDVEIKAQGPHWNNGSMVATPIFLGQSLTAEQIPTLDSGLDSITLSLFESGTESDYFDNWDITGINMRLVPNPGGDVQEACQFDLNGTNTLQDGSTGLVRLSANPGNSGVGRNVTFATPAAASAGGLPGPVYPLPYYQGTGLSDCAPTGAPLEQQSHQLVQPGIQFIFSTGSDNLRQDSGLIAYLFAGKTSANAYDQIQLKNSGDPSWNNYTQQNIIAPLNGPVPDHINMNIQQHDHGVQTDDNWNVDGVNVMVWQAGGPEVCYYKNYQTAGQAADSGGNGAVFKVKDNTIVFSLHNCTAVAGQ